MNGLFERHEHMPKYWRVYQALEREMRIGKLPDGTFLPPEEELAKMFDVGRTTLRLALEQLRTAGLIESRRGRKSVIRNRFQYQRSMKVMWLGTAEFSAIEPIHSMVYQALLRLPEMQRHHVTYWFLRERADEAWLLKQLPDLDGIILSDVRVENLTPELAAQLRDNPRAISLIPENETLVPNLITTDNFAGGAMVARHLLEQGHRRFLVLGISTGLRAGLFFQRLQGFTEAVCGSREIIRMEVLTSERREDFDDVGAFLERETQIAEFDAIYCITDELAQKTVRALREHGIAAGSGPEVIGFGGLPMSWPPVPGLVFTDGIDIEAIAGKIHQLVEQGRWGNSAPGHYPIPPKITFQPPSVRR